MSTAMSPVVITITDAEFNSAQRLAKQTLDVFAGRPGSYNNTANSHLRGKIGEIASARWLSTNGVSVDSLFVDVANLRECDILATAARSLRLDVKTWNQSYWKEMGRCIATSQLSTLEEKADGVLWCFSDPTLRAGARITIVGWNSMSEVRAAPRRWTGPKGKRQVDNYQVPEGDVRSPENLLSALR